MSSSGSTQLLALLLVLFEGNGALAQQLPLAAQHQPPPGTASAGLTQIQRWFELDAPFARQSTFRFDLRPVPTFEPLRLPTFEGTGLLWKRGNLDLSLFERVAPAQELECTFTCQPFLEHALGLDARAALGGIGRRIPEVFLFQRNELVRLPRGFGARSLIGLGGVLDF